ncbi:MAG: hypothetical protein ABR920_13800 [Terriglobales bacterium]
MSVESELNFSAGGVHEVAASVDGFILAGHYDIPDLADAAIAALTDYRAVWSTLNPLATLPDGRALNPPVLTRGSRSKAQHIAKRASLMLDFDPPRPANAMSANEEHDAALAQARECRTWLRSLGWPLLPLCDSGSGAHLRPRVEMTSDGESSRLVQRLLESLHHRYSFVDRKMFDLPRLCRYCGSWNRKSPHNTVERPWRQSAVIDSGDATGALVTREQIESVIKKIGLPTQPAYRGEETPNPAAVEHTIRQLAEWLDKLGVTLNGIAPLEDGRTILRLSHCPLNSSHNRTSAAIGVSVSGRPQNFCRHTSCGMPWSEWLCAVESATGVKLNLGRRLIFGNGVTK